MTNETLGGRPHAGNPQVRPGGEDVASSAATPRRCRKGIILAAAIAVGATLPAETFTVGDWELSGGGGAAITLSYKGLPLLSDVTLGCWTDGYKRGTFNGRGCSVRREGDTVTFSKTGPRSWS